MAAEPGRQPADPRAYVRIAGGLREQIGCGALRPGDPAPSITSLCREHGVARQTAAHALGVLEEEGLVYRVPGLGYYVRSAAGAGSGLRG
jgi:GntR family transcriptional regulator